MRSGGGWRQGGLHLEHGTQDGSQWWRWWLYRWCPTAASGTSGGGGGRRLVWCRHQQHHSAVINRLQCTVHGGGVASKRKL